MFSKYQKSGFGTVKWYMIDHVAEDIERDSGLFLFDAGVYDCSHKIFKKSDAKTWKRITLALDDSISIVGRRLREDGCKKTVQNPRQLPEHNLLNEKEQYMLSVPRKMAYE